MAVDLSDLVEALKREVSPPGDDLFPDAGDEEYLGHLMDAFWETMLDGLISGYTVDDDGMLTPVSGTTDLSRELQQIIVFYAGVRIVRNHLRNMNTVQRSKAGPVEFEIEKSANTLRDLLKELKDRRNLLLNRLSDMGVIPSYYFNVLNERNDSTRWGDDPWPSAGDSR